MPSRLLKFMLVTLISVTFLSGCVTPTYVTKADEFPGMYTEKPKSLLIMPPMNLSTAADAKDYYATTIEMPMAFQGFYVFPYQLTAEVLKQQGMPKKMEE